MRELHANPGVCILAGDPAVRLAAAAADLRPLHAPRLTHPHPHQVSLRAVELPTGLQKISQCPEKNPLLLSAKIITNAWFA